MVTSNAFALDTRHLLRPSGILHPTHSVFDRLYAHDQESRRVTILATASRRDAILERGSHARECGEAAGHGSGGAHCTGVARIALRRVAGAARSQRPAVDGAYRRSR